MHKATKVLDIGMYTGYSALACAEVLPECGEVVTCEFEPYLEELAKELFSKSPHGKKIQVRMGNTFFSFSMYIDKRKVHGHKSMLFFRHFL